MHGGGSEDQGRLGLARFTDPADGAPYLLGSCFPTSAPSVFCCFDQPDLRADELLALVAPDAEASKIQLAGANLAEPHPKTP